MDGENIPSYNFLLVKKGPLSHYCYIKSLSRLLYNQQKSEGHHLYYCVRCLQGFRMERTFEKHSTLCRGASPRPTLIEMPEKGNNTLQFQNYQRQMKALFTIYADCESIIEKIDTCIPPTDELYYKNRNTQAMRLLLRHCKIGRCSLRALFIQRRKLRARVFESSS